MDENAEQNTRVDGLSGSLERFTFRNQDSGFAVVRFLPSDGSPAISLVGHLAQLAEGQHVRISGQRSVHPRYGPRIEVSACEASLPAEVEGIRAYLGSSLVSGIGPAIAERIVARFGTDALRVIADQPERLSEVKGLGKKRIRELCESVRAQQDVQQVMVFLRAHGLGQALAVRIVKRLGRNASALIQANPYQLADEVIGVGFRTADQLAQRLGISADAPARIASGLLHALGEAARHGHCHLPEDALIDAAMRLLRSDDRAVVQAGIEPLVDARRVVREAGDGGPCYYPLVLHQAECGVATMLRALAAQPAPALPLDVGRELTAFEQRRGMRLPEAQRLAVERALTASVSVVTGGPGVGKTTIVRAIAEILTAGGLTLQLAAPTGRAAKRLEESTDRSARTIHRLLEYQAGIGRFMRDHEHPLDGQVLVVDETSMLDIRLAYDLLRAVPHGLRLVFVGDVDQLPSVGPGHVLGDLIDAGIVPVTRLTTIFRQGGDSRIVRAAHAIRQGEVPDRDTEGEDFFFVESRSSAHARALIRELVTQRIPRAFGFDPFRDVQVLSPMYRGEVGADAINQDLQRALNPVGDSIERSGRVFRVGDKVMQVRNDYDLEVYNGDLGRVASIDHGSGTLSVTYERRGVQYPFGELEQLVPAYAITVHRAQGSEYPAVILPLTTDHFLMLKRNLLYTAITRGRRLVVLVGSRRALDIAVHSRDEHGRHTGLAARLRADGPPTTAVC